jgi:hypothetical protein
VRLVSQKFILVVLDFFLHILKLFLHLLNIFFFEVYFVLLAFESQLTLLKFGAPLFQSEAEGLLQMFLALFIDLIEVDIDELLKLGSVVKI